MALNISKIIDEVAKRNETLEEAKVLQENENIGEEISAEEEINALISNYANEFAAKSWAPSISAGIGAVTAIENVRKTLDN
jgi:nitrate reductase alpha subunit